MKNNNKGRGNGKGKGKGKPRPNSGGSSGSNKKVGLTAELKHHVFDYGYAACAELLTTSWEKFVTYIGQKLSEDIASELRTRETLVLPKPEIPDEVIAKYEEEIARMQSQQERLLVARQSALQHLELALGAADPGSEKAKLEIEIAELRNEIEELVHSIANPPDIVLRGLDKIQHEAAWKSHTVRCDNLVKHRGQAHNLLLGQCTKILDDQMKHDDDYKRTVSCTDPLQLFRLIEKTVLLCFSIQQPNIITNMPSSCKNTFPSN